MAGSVGDVRLPYGHQHESVEDDKEALDLPRKASMTLEQIDEGWSDDPRNPQNWPRSKRWRITVVILVTAFLCTAGSSIIAPATHQILDDLIGPGGNEQVGILLTSVYVLGLGTGPFLFSPLSELYGRQVAYVLSSGLMVVFCAACCIPQSLSSLIALRFFCGVFGSSGPALGVATVADMFKLQERGLPVAIYALGPMSGPTLGTMLGFWLLLASWRWVLGALAIMVAVNFVVIASCMEETYPLVLKRMMYYRQTHALKTPSRVLGRLSPAYLIRKNAWMSTLVPRSDARRVFGNAFSRPPRLLLTNPVCLIFSTYYAYLYGIIYVFIVSTPILYGSPPFSLHGLFSYGFGPATLPLAYIGLAVGFFAAAAVAGVYQDRIYRVMSKRNHTDGAPEYRLVLVQIGSIIFPLGLFIFSWCARAHTHWMGPQVGQAILGLGLLVAWQSLQTYLVDAFSPYSAAAVAGATALRSMIGAVMPILSPILFRNLGWGKGGTILACLAAAAIPAPFLMLRYGQRLRERYQFHG